LKPFSFKNLAPTCSQIHKQNDQKSSVDEGGADLNKFTFIHDHTYPNPVTTRIGLSSVH
jgi:hypothetical protein